jgi:prepilin-type N-terminal cleavage/methylation domain-containing protein
MQKRGFTLLELSVVLIIVSLVIGGIILSRSLIRQAKVNAVLMEYDVYVKAIQEFQDKYQAIPGDMTNATTIWGAAICPNLGTTPQFLTCNGDGNGRVGISSSAGVLTNPTGEWWLAWQHLANSGLIEGRYSGGVAASPIATIGTNVPASKLVPGGWTLLYYLNTPNLYGHILSFGGASTSYTKDSVLTANEAHGLDEKIDDGIHNSGKVHNQGDAAWGGDTGQATSALFFVLGF